jgi:hypothetical protein
MCRPQSTTIDFARRSALLAALLAGHVSATVAHAFDPAAPAQLNVLVRDDDGKPLSGVDVTSSGPRDIYGQRPTSHAVTDAAGVAIFEVARPQTLREPTWDAEVELSKPGHIGQSQHIRFFPGAVIDREWTLHEECKTLIRFRGPNDEPIAGAQFHLAADEFLDLSPRSDARGEYLCVHPPWPDGFGVGFGWDDMRHCADEPDVTLRYAASALPRALSPRQIDLRVLSDDGRPAAGWFLISDAVHAGAGGIGNSEPTEFFHCGHLHHLGDQAATKFLLANDLLFVVSPGGAPFRFRLNPAAWPERGDEVHRLTLTIPPVRERHAGRLAWQDGEPIGNVPLVVEQTDQTNLNWYDPAGNRRFNYHAVWHAAADDGAHVVPLRTDAAGRYELPFYFGGQSEFRLATYGYWAQGLGSQPQVVLKRSAIRPDDYREITIVFRDEKGHRIDNVEIASFRAYHDIKEVASHGSGGATVDRRGHHLFVPVVVDQLKLETKSAFWEPHMENLDVPPQDTQFEIVLPDSTRRKVLSGVVLGPDGQPVPGVTLRKLNPPAWRRVRGTPYAHGQATTDSLGRFSFDKMPEQDEAVDGHLAVSRRGNDDIDYALPGWTDEVPFSVDSGDLTIRLKPGGTVRVFLPPDDRDSFQVSIGGLSPLEGPMSYHRLHYDSATQSMLARDVRPGRYQLWVRQRNRQEPAAEEHSAERPPVDVAAGSETLIDLRPEKFPEPAPRPNLSIAVSIEQDGMPVKGAQVFVYSLSHFDKRLAADLSNARADVRKRAIERFEKSGIAAIAPLRTLLSSDDADLRTSARTIEKAFEQYFDDDLKEAGADIGDDSGRAWFQAFSGKSYIAVARLPGRSIGYRVFTAEQGSTPAVEMQRTRALRVSVALEKNGHAALSLYLPRTPAEQAVALYHVWRDPSTYAGVTYHDGRLVVPVTAISRDFAEGRSEFLIEDLPIGTRCELHLKGRSEQSLQQIVTIDDESAAVQTIELKLLPASEP